MAGDWGKERTGEGRVSDLILGIVRLKGGADDDPAARKAASDYVAALVEKHGKTIRKTLADTKEIGAHIDAIRAERQAKAAGERRSIEEIQL
jgi:hypothetical protein